MSDEFIGAVINGYEVLSLIGVGGMARVYLARQTSMNRQVALKVLPTQFVSDDTYLQRFHREVKIVSQLEHAHIVPVYDYGEYNSQPFIVMRYMAGGSVDDLLDRGALDLEQILHVITQIAPALDHAHAKGVLHRDLKPSNVLLDETGSAFISDFGIARLNESKGANITTQGVVGTPSYMSPEQAQGKEMDGRSDIYSLGVMLFELATGRRPFEAETPYSIAVMQVTTPPPNPRTINPLLPQSVERVILRTLRKEPSERPAKAALLAQELRKAINDANKEDTDLKLKQVAVAPQMAYPAPTSYAPEPPRPLVSTPNPVYNPQPMYTPNPNQISNPSYTGPLLSPSKPQRRGSPWMGAILGGGIGCLFLVVLIAIGAMVVTNILPNRINTDFVTATVESGVFPSQSASEAPTRNVTLSPTPTLDSTSEAARSTLLARQADVGATLTANAPFSTENGGSSGSSSSAFPSSEVSVPVLTGVLGDASGTILYADQRGDSESFQIVKLNLETQVETQLTADNADNSYPVASPDGRWVAFQSDRDGDFEIYVMTMAGGQLRKLTDNTYLDRLPSWSPNGEWVLYAADVRGDGSYDLLRTKLDASVTEVVLSNDERKSHARYSPDGRYIVYTTGTDLNDSRTWEIARLDTQSGEILKLTTNDVRDASPVYSPDGERIVYITTTTEADNAIATMNAEGDDVQILFDDGANNWSATYSPNGEYIVFTRYDGVSDQLYLMTSDGETQQQLTTDGGNYGTWYGG